MAKAKKSRTSSNYRTANAAFDGSRRIFDDVLALAGTLARGRKDLGADKLHSLAALTRDYAASMTDLPNLRVQVASAADSLEGVADYVMHTEIEQMVGDAGTFARRHPLATLAVTVAAGMAASRLMYRQPAGHRQVQEGQQSRAAPRQRELASGALRHGEVPMDMPMPKATAEPLHYRASKPAFPELIKELAGDGKRWIDAEFALAKAEAGLRLRGYASGLAWPSPVFRSCSPQ